MPAELASRGVCSWNPGCGRGWVTAFWAPSGPAPVLMLAGFTLTFEPKRPLLQGDLLYCLSCELKLIK